MCRTKLDNLKSHTRKRTAYLPQNSVQASIAIRKILVAFGLLAAACVPSWSQSAEDLEKQYNREKMEQALQTREHYDLYGIHFESDQSALDPAAGPLLDDI